MFDLLASLRAGVLVTEYFSRRVRLVAPTNLGSLTVYYHRSQVQDKAINQIGGQGGKHDIFGPNSKIQSARFII